MTTPRWERLKDIFQQALDRADADRAAFVAGACGDDEELRTEVDALLRSHGAAAAFLETPAVAYVGVPAAAPVRMVGQRVGAFRVIAEIGRGGMGAVYRARREGVEYAQDVALKIVPPGPASEQFSARFRQERRILAALEHPNIARLIDGGNTDDGLPFFAMEFVDGQPIDTFCTERELGLRERLDLFRSVCDAVAYANRKLIVHRDLKPTNIMVARDGSPKLLDFGIAKLLSGEDADGAALTQTGFGVMTPECASPEQVRGELITTSTDVYALGLLLYLLLTGKKPYEVSRTNAEEAARVICQQEPKPPSAAGGATGAWRIPADVDTIVLKSLRKEPDRRYASAADLSEDIRRYMVGLPVHARPDTITYRTSRFVARHLAVVATTALAFLFLAGGLVATLYQARIAETNRERAEQRFQQVRRIANTLIFELNDSIADIPGTTKARAQLLKRASDLLETLSADAPRDPVLGEEVAAAYHRLGGVLSSPGESNLGQRKASIEAHRKGLAIRQQLASAAPADDDRQDRLASSHISVSYVLPDAQEALGEARAAASIASRITTAHPENRAYQRRLANARFAEAAHLLVLGKADDAIEAFEHVAEMYQRLLASQPDDATLIRNATLTHKRLGAVLVKAGRFPEALDHYRRAVRSDEQQAASKPGREARYDLSVSLTDLGTAMGASGDFAGQIEKSKQALAIREELSRADPDDVQIKAAVVSVLVRLGRASVAIRQHEDALSYLNRARTISESRGGDLQWTTDITNTLSSVHRALGHWDEAVRWARATIENAGRAAARNPSNAWERVNVAWAWFDYAELLSQRALRPGQDRDAAANDWIAAAAGYRAAQAEVADLAARGQLVGRDADLPARARAGLARCERAQALR